MNKKALLTTAVLLPIVYFIGQMIWQFSLTSKMMGQDDPIEMMEDLFRGLSFVMFIALVVLVVIIISMAYLVKHIQVNDGLTKGNKIMWIVLIFAFQSIPMIVYMFKYIYKKPWKELLVKAKGEMTKLTMITGIVTFVPVVFLMIFMFEMSTSMSGFMTAAMNGGSDATVMAFIMPIIILEIALFLVLFLVFIYYLVIVLKNKELDNGRRTMWLVLMFFFNILAMSVYWIVHMLFKAEAMEQNQIMSDDL